MIFFNCMLYYILYNSYKDFYGKKRKENSDYGMQNNDKTIAATVFCQIAHATYNANEYLLMTSCVQERRGGGPVFCWVRGMPAHLTCKVMQMPSYSFPVFFEDVSKCNKVYSGSGAPDWTSPPSPPAVSNLSSLYTNEKIPAEKSDRAWLRRHASCKSKDRRRGRAGSGATEVRTCTLFGCAASRAATGCIVSLSEDDGAGTPSHSRNPGRPRDHREQDLTSILVPWGGTLSMGRRGYRQTRSLSNQRHTQAAWPSRANISAGSRSRDDWMIRRGPEGGGRVKMIGSIRASTKAGHGAWRSGQMKLISWRAF